MEVRPNYYGYGLQVDGHPLTEEQTSYFFRSVHKIHKQNRQIIFRGDKKKTLLELYGLNEAASADELRHSLFLIGAKSGMFKMGLPGLNEIDIAEAGGNEFSLVFQMLANLVVKEFPFSARRNAVIAFRANQSEVIKYFKERENEQRFIQIVEGLSYEARVMIRDYYLALLHHIGKSDYSSSSFLLSTTLNFSQAYKFAWKDEEKGSDNPIILMGWIPEGYEGILSVAYATKMKKRTKIEKLGLPVYERSFFPKQEEVTLKGGLLPYYLLGYLYMKEDDEIFEINPALFQTQDSWNGLELPVDQSSFPERIKQTAFGRYFSVDDANGEYGQFKS